MLLFDVMLAGALIRLPCAPKGPCKNKPNSLSSPVRDRKVLQGKEGREYGRAGETRKGEREQGERR